MADKIKTTEEYANHPKDKGVYLKHFFCSSDNDRVNNLEVKIEPGCQISPHVHENSNEFYYVVGGEGEFLINGQWTPVKMGYALKAPMGEEHGLRNKGEEPFILFSTFSPPIR